MPVSSWSYSLGFLVLALFAEVADRAALPLFSAPADMWRPLSQRLSPSASIPIGTVDCFTGA
jgi:hypothetical protein